MDNGTDKVYQYVGAASRNSGSQNAAATFALNPYDTNPQGIADPPPADMLLAPNPRSAAGTPSLTSRDAGFVSLAQEPLQRASELLSGGAETSFLDSLAPFADLAWTTAGAFGEPNPLAPLTLLAPMSSQAGRPDGSAMGPQGGALAYQDSGASMDSFAAGQTNESVAEE